MIDMAFTRDQLKAHVKAQLGWPATCVELTEEHFEDAVFEAELWVMTHLGFSRDHEFFVNTGSDGYEMPSDCIAVYHVALPEPESAIDAIVGLEGFEASMFSRLWRGSTRGLASNNEIMQIMQQRETFNRTIGVDPTWFWDREKRRLFIRPGRWAGKAVASYASSRFSYDRMTLAQRHILRRYAVAVGKLILGQIRSKFSEIPASGQRITMNGSELTSSAESELIALDDKMRSLRPPISFMMG